MDNPLATSLLISATGIGALFIALGLLCGLMYLLTASPRRRSRERPDAQDDALELLKLRAAAIAVALARAEIEASSSAFASDEGSSSWRSFHHQRTLNLNLADRRDR
jgi:Na+-transporting methylmalonyl-CoA/oxaloacetate decarboxylase gamma subunit